MPENQTFEGKEQESIDDMFSSCSPEDIEAGKTIAIISYLTLIGLIIAFVMNNEKKNCFGAFHIRQMLGLGLTFIALSIVAAIIPIIGWFVVGPIGSILLLIMWISGLINAINGKIKPMPILGNKYAEWFKGV